MSCIEKKGQMTLPVKVVVIAARRLGLSKTELKLAVNEALARTTLASLTEDEAVKVLAVLAEIAKAGCWEKYEATKHH